MGTWVKETDEAIYLMQGNQWISRILKKPSTTESQGAGPQYRRNAHLVYPLQTLPGAVDGIG